MRRMGFWTEKLMERMIRRKEVSIDGELKAKRGCAKAYYYEDAAGKATKGHFEPCKVQLLLQSRQQVMGLATTPITAQSMAARLLWAMKLATARSRCLSRIYIIAENGKKIVPIA